MDKPVTLEELKSRKKKIRKSVWIALDPELAEMCDDQKAEVNVLRIRAENADRGSEIHEKLEDAETKLTALEMKLRENSVEFIFEGIGRQGFEDLLLSHPPTPDQRADQRRQGRGELNWNPDTFPPILVAESLISPGLSAEDVKALWNDPSWSAAETTALFMAALEANSSRRTYDLGKG